MSDKNRIKKLTEKERNECIKKIAYNIWLRDGGNDVENWLKAELIFERETKELMDKIKNNRHIKYF